MKYRKQIERNDCAILVIQNIYKYYYDKWLNISEIKKEANFNKDGINIFEFVRLSKKFNINSTPLKGDIDSFLNIKTNDSFITLIKNENFYHYIIVKKIIDKKLVVYFDPIFGKTKMSIEEFKTIYSGIVIKIEKTKDRVKSNVKESPLSITKLEINKISILFLVLNIFLLILIFIGTYYMKIIWDIIIPSNNNFLLFKISLIFILSFFIRLIIESILDLFLQNNEMVEQKKIINSYLEKLTKIKWTKINHYDNLDHFKNIDLLIKISIFKSRYIFVLFSELFSLLFSSIIILIFSLKIFVLLCIFSFISIFISKINLNKIEKSQNEAIQYSYKFKESLISIFENIVEFKLEKNQSFLLEQTQKNLNIFLSKNRINYLYNARYLILKNFFNSLKHFLLVILIVIEIWNLNFSMSNIFIILNFSNIFNFSFNKISELFMEYSVIKKYLENVESFFILEEEQKSKKLLNIEKIKEIRIEKIDFSYVNQMKRMIIKNYDFSQRNRIIGINGSGKSTLMKILSTLITDQEIKINNKNIELLDISSIRKEIMFLENNIFLPNTTIFYFLTNNDNKNKQILLNNIEKYNLLIFFDEMNLSLNYKIENNGKNLSLGQRQFINLMKLFSSEYSVVFLDEAFDNLNNDIYFKLKRILEVYLESKIIFEISHNNLYLYSGKEFNCEFFQYNK